ncbi:HAD-IB family phosphatase [Nocardia huaxiensis]|uniref:HAD-IB family phosphatase n=1 Tax=Nocardia huaxiensis TaxID=2755382 RepID=A0A7D6ZIL6_9NOCA|nr:HAD-IB family phosphatase [Nocardia huaxiensis]QLY28723.1 HAD-IB family phosphatase [Nocardia huaxiensis]
MDECEIVVFDLDGTLVRGDSFSRFLTELFLRRPLHSLLASIPALPLSLFPRWRRPAANLWLRAATTGLTEARYQQLVESYVRRRYSPTPGRPIHAALTRLHAHQTAGHTVIVVTGSEERLAREICRSLGLEGIEVVGTTLVPHRGAMELGIHCYGPAKLQRLREKGFSGPISCVYTDSSVDLPLLTAATQRFLVEPATTHRKRIHATLGHCAILE